MQDQTPIAGRAGSTDSESIPQRDKLRPFLAALGLVSSGDPLPALSQWRRSARSARSGR